MKISFAPLATVSIAHGYYSGGCRDIEFLPSAGTQSLLRAGRMLARMLDGQLHLLYEAESPGVPVSSLAGKSLHFGLRLTNPSFENITEPVLADASLTPFFTNAALPGALDAARGVALVAGLYTHAPSRATRPVRLSLRDAAANTLDVRQASEATTSYDLRGLPSGEYLIEEDYGAGVSLARQLFVDAELRDTGVWGLLSLRIDAAFYASAASFALNFAAREETLRYYVVAKNWPPAEFDQLNVVDAGFSTEGRDEIAFTRLVAPFPNGFINASLLGDGSAQIAVFQSQTEVARRERGLRKLHLSRNATVLIEHLPLPGPERAKADLIVHLSKP
ncbi:MAG: hypothetical protein B7Y41_04380 [Hydrogenophilales bacterium 28-61-23]|nr:MAG: hypothetical protein B7Y41_04380 [Hydrogenophilales bacterium 28-61-23]